ncbi:hypothetical protein GBA52_010850 [Prunus armeniaca]|nr:hypothetical protein GBA52_010850 [Prunus armeniaca]
MAISSMTTIDADLVVITIFILSATCPRFVFSIRPATNLANFTFVSHSSVTKMTGVRIFFTASKISLIRGTPSVMFMLATPAKWKAFSVICVAGSQIL